MKFRYIGEYPNGQQSLLCYGITFTPGAELEIPGKFVNKALGNPFFEEVKDSPKQEHSPQLETDNGHDKAALISEAEILGVKIDKRWSVEKIAAAIKAHYAAEVE